MTVRYKLKKDEHHAAIAAALVKAGFFVEDLSAVGRGCPDLLISRNSVWCLVEIKTAVGHKTALDRLRPNQIVWHTLAKGPIITAYTATEIVRDFNLLIKRREAWAIT